MTAGRAARARIAVALGEGDTAMFEPLQLVQVLVNLLRNALDAVDDRADPRIEIASQRRDGRLVLSVTDSGAGIAQDSWDEIFDPFFTTKPEGKGLGLGLAISAAIARDFGATLALVPSDRGARFELSLVPAPVAAPAEPVPA